MQTLHQELEPAPRALNTSDHPVFREMMADPAVAYAEEVRALRRRVALLEAELAATKATAAPARPAPPLTSVDFAAPQSPVRRVSEFTESVAPAVMAAQPAQPVQPTAPVQQPAESTSTGIEADQPASDPGFAQAWSAEAAATSFEERVAEKAFFQASTVDQESRSWLLDH